MDEQDPSIWDDIVDATSDTSIKNAMDAILPDKLVAAMNKADAPGTTFGQALSIDIGGVKDSAKDAVPSSNKIIIIGIVAAVILVLILLETGKLESL